MSEFQAHTLYDLLAPFYERHWGGVFLENSIRLFQRKLSPHLKRGDSVLELCCGTGHFARWLAEQGYQVTALDRSRLMLGYARKRLTRGRLFQADARDFRLRHKVHAAVCFYNSLNHFLEPSSFRAVLGSAYRHLNPGGWFLFDIVLEHGYAQFWETDETVRYGERICELRYRFDKSQNLASCLVTVGSIHGPTGHPSQLLLEQRAYSLPFVAEELRVTGFQLVQVKPVQDCKPPDGRVAILARRPLSPNESPSRTGSLILPNRFGTE
jgi:ubiquinone/menaquinone biosynthesis C-methylase UbiE